MTEYDITHKVGPLFPLPLRGEGPEIPMCSYDRPAYLLWNAIGRALHEKGWSDEAIAEWLRSKGPRWALDGNLGAAIESLGHHYAQKIAREG